MKSVIIALVGNPNCGKSTLFNGLTGKQQKVGNWPGVTVEKKQGQYNEGCIHFEVVDLPGCYSCDITLERATESALDERITQEYLLSNQAELIINVVDATHLERHLYLTLQLLERGIPMIVALNMMDAANKQKIYINIQTLAERLGCPVIPLVAVKEQGIEELKKAILQNCLLSTSSPLLSNIKPAISSSTIDKAKAHYDRIQNLLAATVQRTQFTHYTLSENIDSIFLNRWLGLPLFFILMYLVFVFSIHASGVFQDFFDIASKTIFVDGVREGLEALQAPEWLTGLLAFGLGQGINTTISFVPVITCMFLCLTFLEASGYMARAAFVMDKIMQWAGLPGKSFVPMIIGFGCNVPAVMATRTLENYRERILTILMSPFMSCGARLAIYALFVSAFFPIGGQNIIFGLYLIGILVALLTGFILRKTLLRGEHSSLLIEFPPYRWPSLRMLGRSTWHRLKRFITKAGMLIIPVCMIIGVLGSLQDRTKMGNWITTAGQAITPFFAPMGLKENNWPATVGLLTGVLAKEVVVGTLNALYSQESMHLLVASSSSTSSISISMKDGLAQALKSIPENAIELTKSLSHPFSDTTVETAADSIHSSAVGTMVERFGSKTSAFAYLLFVLLYFPCISVVAVIARELNKSWAIFSVLWTTSIAYIVAVLFYQCANFMNNPFSSCAWIMGMLVLTIAGIWGMRAYIHHKTARKSPLNAKSFKPLPTEILILK